MPTIEESEATKAKLMHLHPSEPPVSPTRNPVVPEPVFPTYPRFLVTSLPVSVTYQPDALRQFYRGGVPQERIIPTQ